MDIERIRSLHEAYGKVCGHAYSLGQANFGEIEKLEALTPDQLKLLDEIFIDFMQQPDSEVFGPSNENTGEDSVFEGQYMAIERTITLPDGKKFKISYEHDEGKRFVIAFDKTNPEAEYLEEVFENALIGVGTVVDLEQGGSYPKGYVTDHIESAQAIHSMFFPVRKTK